jgi:hypothetical protein
MAGNDIVFQLCCCQFPHVISHSKMPCHGACVSYRVNKHRVNGVHCDYFTLPLKV